VSETYEPNNRKPGKYEATFSSDRAKFVRVDGHIETSTEITVTSGDNAEIRRLTLRITEAFPMILKLQAILRL
jgi:hypothetical protein